MATPPKPKSPRSKAEGHETDDERGVIGPAWGGITVSEDYAAVSERLRMTREALGLTQKEIAQRAGMSSQSWNNCERGRERISIRAAIRLARTFGLNLDWIYLGRMDMLPKATADGILRVAEEAGERRTKGTTETASDA